MKKISKELRLERKAARAFFEAQQSKDRLDDTIAFAVPLIVILVIIGLVISTL